MKVRDLNHTVRHICHVVYVYCKMLKDFHDYCLFNMSDQLVVGIVFSTVQNGLTLAVYGSSKRVSRSGGSGRPSMYQDRV